jgi:TIR domain
MIDSDFKAAREALHAWVADSTLTLDERALLLRLADALDRLLALLSSHAWQEAGKLPRALADAGAAAGAELVEALGAAGAVIAHAPRGDTGFELARRMGQAAIQFELLLATRSQRNRSPGPTLAVASRSPAPQEPPTIDAHMARPAEPAAEPVTVQPVPDDASFGASAPRTVGIETPFVARFVAYAQGQRDRAQELLAGQRSQTGVGMVALARGTRVEVALYGARMAVEGEARCVQAFVWTGEPVVLNWAVQATGTHAGATLLCFDVLLDGLVLARVRLELDVVAEASKAPAGLSTGESRIARKAFASYSSKDRLRVLDRVASIRLAAAVEVFLDCHDLNPGEAWRSRLEREIDACDTFMLFWSEAAAMSNWVRWEWERALAVHGLEHMQFHPLENGVVPPDDLSAIHVGDPYVDLRMAERLRHATNAS